MNMIAQLAAQLSQEGFVTIVGPGGGEKTSVALAVAEAVAADSSMASGWSIWRSLATLAWCRAHWHPCRDRRRSPTIRSLPWLSSFAASRCSSCWTIAHTSLRRRPPWLAASCAAPRACASWRPAAGHCALRVNLCRKLDGLPLAIEFAAGQIDTFGVRELSARLAGGMQLSGGYRTALPRHQTLRAMLDSSHDWLPEPERVVFRRLSIFPSEFSLDAANIVAAGGEVAAAEVVDHVASLARKSLVTANVFGKKPVYRLLETTRCYALDKLRESGEFDVVARRHAECCPDLLSLAEAAE
jgi:predicted ATPase